ncbi:MAG: HesA/MoeB/ThiF family protein [Proteobacteria bacterium]|nr:HesA/MoeB/ThiF family protein [Pseudomonadota bacterium]
MTKSFAQTRLMNSSIENCDLSEDEREIYSRQVFFLGEDLQKELKQKRVLVIGAGGLGSPILFYLAAAGVGNITICDFDTVELTNLNRQIIHNRNRIGQNKAQSAKKTLESFNDNINVHAVTDPLPPQQLLEKASQCDLVIEATDSMEHKEIMNQLLVAGGISCIHGILLGFAGFSLLSMKGSTCLSCLFKKAPVYSTGRALPFKFYPSFGASAGSLGSLICNISIRYLLSFEVQVVNKIIYLSQLLPFKQLMLCSRGLKAIMSDHFKDSLRSTSREFPENNTLVTEHVVTPNPECNVCKTI